MAKELNGLIPKDGEDVIVVEQYTPGNYKDMRPGTIVMDYRFGCFWNVLSNDNGKVQLKNCVGGDAGVEVTVTPKNSSFVFVLLAKEEEEECNGES